VWVYIYSGVWGYIYSGVWGYIYRNTELVMRSN